MRCGPYHSCGKRRARTFWRLVVPILVCSPALSQSLSVLPPSASSRQSKPEGVQPQHFEITKARVRVEGTSNIDNWQVESSSLQGFLELGLEFAFQRNLKANPGPIEARARIELGVFSLKSVEKDGKPFSNKMDEIMYEKLLAEAHPRIVYRLKSLVLREAAQDEEAPFLLESTGDFSIAGITNQVSLPVKLWSLDNKHLRISGSTSVRMTDFGIKPPALKIALGAIKTEDEVKIAFECVLLERESFHE